MKMPLILLVVGLYAPTPALACGLSLYSVTGSSMAPLIYGGDRLETLSPACLSRSVRRGDVVVFTSGADPRPLIKRVVAQPGDRFSVAQGLLTVNGDLVLTTQGIPYGLDSARLAMIALYERDYRGVIPQGALLVLGDRQSGTADSSQFGLVSITDVKGVLVTNLSAADRER